MPHTILHEIDQLLEEVTHRIQSIEDGTFWDRPGRSEESVKSDLPAPIHPQEPNAVSDTQAKALTDLFERVDRLFVNREFALAAQAYDRLFRVFDLGWQLTLPGFDETQTKARYLRCLIETSSGHNRTQTVLKAMLPEPDDLNWHEALQHPTLRDLQNALPTPIPLWNTLLADIKKILATKHGTCARLLFLESLALTEGIPALEQFTQTHQDREPLAFACWIASEQGAGNWTGMKRACLNGLQTLPPAKELPSPYDPRSLVNIRWHLAHCLLQAGTALRQAPTLLQARWELFVEAPSDSSLRQLLLQAESMGQAQTHLDRACQFLHDETKLIPLTMKAELLRGNWGPVFALRSSRKAKTLGWSDPGSPEGLYVASLLAALCGDSAPSTQVVTALLQRYADRPDPEYAWATKELSPPQTRAPASFYSDRILQRLQRSPLPPNRWDQLFRGVETLVRQRIRAILDERMRGAYDRAAMLLGALVETRLCHGDRSAAASLVHQFTRVQYRNLLAFHRALEPYLKECELR